MSKIPLVSVVMPVYNCERFVAEAVRSALDQDHPNKEILIINDGSKDGSLQALEPFGDAIRVITVPNGGPARARNLGMQLAQGEYIAFLDADDVWARRKLSCQVAHMQAKPELGGCYTAWHVWPAEPDGRWVRPATWVDDLAPPQAVPGRSGWIYGELLFECHMLTTTVMLRTSTVRAIGEFDVKLPVGEDYDYWLRLAHHAPVDRLNCTGALYRVVPGSASRRPHAVNYELEVLQRAMARFGTVNPDGQVVSAAAMNQRVEQLMFQHAYNHLYAGDPVAARRGFAQMLQRSPLRPRLWAHWLRAAWKGLAQAQAGARA